MAPSAEVKFPHILYFFLLATFFSCEKDFQLIADATLENKKIGVLDDNFRIPPYQESILDVLSNDTHISDNVKIIEIGTPSNGSVKINEDNTITYIPNSIYTYQDAAEEKSDATTTEETTIEEGTPQETSSEEVNGAEQTEQEASIAQEQETPSTESNAEDNGTEESPGEESTEQTSDNESENEATSSENEAATTPDPSTNQEATDDVGEAETTMPEENQAESTPESEDSEQTEEDTFTYTTETENEDGTVNTETGIVTVEVEPAPEEESDPVPVVETQTEIDYWRNPVIAASRILDDKYYDLDTGEIYPKEVNLQRGQVQNYIEHENCPQRIKDKWDNRIEITPADVNGSQNGLQAIFDAHPRGSLFYLRSGVYQDQKNAVLNNDQDVVGEYGAILDGSGIQGNSVESTRAIRSMERGYICNLKVREYPTWNDPQNPRNPRGATLEVIQNGAILNCEVHSHNKAISVVYGSKAMWNKFTAGRLGIYGYGHHEPNHSYRRGAIVKYNEWYGCNFNNYDQHHEAGGSKFVNTDGTIWSHNYIHDNPSGSGIWNDGGNRETEIYNNVFINTYRSVFIEASSTANIHHNTIEYGIGFGAIYISTSQGNKVHHNLVRWSRNGIAVRDVPRNYSSTLYLGQENRGVNNEIYANHIWQQTDGKGWTTGKATLFDGIIELNENSNRWHDNHYYIDDNAEGAALFSEEQPFMEVFMFAKSALSIDHQPLSWEEWKENTGEENSTLEYARYF